MQDNNGTESKEKKEPFVKALDDIQKIENLSVNNSAHSYTESAYKELEEAAIKQGHVIESPEPQEKLKKGDAGFKWFTCPTCDGRGSVPQVSAPSESQEDMWNEVNEHINAQIGDYISLEAVKLSFILTRKPE